MALSRQLTYHYEELTEQQRAALWVRLIERRTVDTTGCQLVGGHALHSGHVQLTVGSRHTTWIRVRAHVFAWERANGRSVPAGNVVRHTCDTPRCVNPDHLVLGTQADNIADAVAKGRFSRWHVTRRRLDGRLTRRYDKQAFESTATAVHDVNRASELSDGSADVPPVTYREAV